MKENKPKFQITTSAYNKFVSTVGSTKAESGGIFFGSLDDYVITDFVFDQYAKTTGSTYTLNTDFLNPILTKHKQELIGVGHAHPKGCGQLSSQDITYFKKLFNYFDVEKLFVPICFSGKDTSFEFIPYIIYKNGDVVKAELEILPDNYLEYLAKKSQNVKEVATSPAKKEIAQTQREVLKTEKEVVINLHNTVTLKGRLEPITIYSEKNEEEVKPSENTVFEYIYHGFLMLFLLIVFVFLVFLSPNIYKFFINLLN